MQRGVRPMTLEYKSASTTFDMPGWYCEKSDESIHTGEDMKVSDRALNRRRQAWKACLRRRKSSAFARMLGLTQEEAGELIGGGPRAFQKYEAGDLLPSRAIGSALALLDRDPEGLSVLHVRPHIISSEKPSSEHHARD